MPTTFRELIVPIVLPCWNRRPRTCTSRPRAVEKLTVDFRGLGDRFSGVVRRPKEARNCELFSRCEIPIALDARFAGRANRRMSDRDGARLKMTDTGDAERKATDASVGEDKYFGTTVEIDTAMMFPHVRGWRREPSL